MANYETYAAYERIIETGNAHHFRNIEPKDNAEFLKQAFKSGSDSFIQSDSVLSKLDFRKIKLFPLACCLSCGGDRATLDLFCADWLHMS